ncbi:efflux RND transporter periplasmic adaptor subunit [Novosphingobium sp. KCTC 2891]|nr:efflux RND transporter periplasmic adaptor subunit [Novosphingobium sp. KCTC 2891]
MALAGSLRGADAPVRPAEPPATPVQVFVVGAAGQGTNAGMAAAHAATLHRDREATLSFRLGGKLIAVPVRYGQRLGAGALVAAIDATPYAAASARQAADVARAGRAAERYGALAPEGAISDAQARDARDALAAARAGQASAHYDLASTRLTMPFAGVVLSRSAEAGETVAPGQAVAVVADLSSPLIAVAQVPVAAAAGLRPGMGARVTVPGRAEPMAARVLRIAGGGDARSGTVLVDVAVIGDGGLASGTPASVAFEGDGGARQPTGEVLIPAEAILDAQGARASVYVIDARGRARRTEVVFGGFADRFARVTGLPAGARVITAGAGFVGNGDPVAVTGA